MAKVRVRAKRNFEVGPWKSRVIDRGEERVVEVKNNQFFTNTNSGSFFGYCNIGDGWEVVEIIE